MRHVIWADFAARFRNLVAIAIVVRTCRDDAGPVATHCARVRCGTQRAAWTLIDPAVAIVIFVIARLGTDELTPDVADVWIEVTGLVRAAWRGNVPCVGQHYGET